MFAKKVVACLFVLVSINTYSQKRSDSEKLSSFALGYTNSSYYNLRYISNRWKVFTEEELHETTEEEQEAKPAKWRFMAELLIGRSYADEKAGIAANIYYTFYTSKIVQLNAIGGLKMVGIPKQNIPPPNYGLMAQINAYIFYPFIEITHTSDDITYLTAGIDFRISRVYKKLKRKYDLDLVQEKKWW